MYKKIEKCRICENTELIEVLDLGVQALTGVFPKSKNQHVTAAPLKLVKCTGAAGVCGLLQLQHTYDLGELYGDNYGYRSGLNASMVAHLKAKVAKILGQISLPENALVIDIGSNDSTTLQAYPATGLKLVGIDPTGRKFSHYYPQHIQLIPDFFSAATVHNHLGNLKASVITSFSMFYDLERPMSFMQEVCDTLTEEGIWVFEQSYMPTMLQRNSYDTACHEHLEYYALKQIKWMADRGGLKIIDVEFNDVNGGSFSVTAAKQSSRHMPSPGAALILKEEVEQGLDTLEPYRQFALRVADSRMAVRKFLSDARGAGKRLGVLGASTKGNVLLQYCSIDASDVACVGEVNSDKFGSFTPGSLLPIIPEDEMLAMELDYLLVLPWHFRAYFEEKQEVRREDFGISASGAGCHPMQWALRAVPTDTARYRFLLLVVGAILVLLGGIWLNDARALVFFGCSAGLVLLVVVYKFDYLHPAVAYVVPWLTVLIFSTIPISTYSRELQYSTCLFLLATVLVWLLSTVGAPVFSDNRRPQSTGLVASAEPEMSVRFKKGILVAFAIMYLFAAFNVAYAGYIPLVSLLTTGAGDSGYATFGIPSVYGAFLAYANAVGCLGFYAYQRTHSKMYLWLFLSVIVMHLLLVNRQNVITLSVEAFVIRSLMVRRLSKVKILVLLAIGLSALGALGELRSGDIRSTIGVEESYSWVPLGAIWLYAYSYFNVLNLENTMVLSDAPYYDGSMWENLLPTILRPTAEHTSYLELEAMNVSSYIFPIYTDVGRVGVLLWTAIWGFITTYTYRRALAYRRFAHVASYACLFFCALLSFFVAFWFYLPVIFQIAFFWLFEILLFKRPAAKTVNPHE